MQRAMSVVWPHRMKVLCTRKKSKFTFLAVVLFITLVHGHVLFDFDLDTYLGKTVCSTHLYYSKFLSQNWSWVDMLFFTLLPFLLLVGSNVILIWKLTSAAKNARMTLSSVQSDRATPRKEHFSSLTITLVFLSLTFMLLAMPLAIFNIIQEVIIKMGKDTNELDRYVFFLAVCLLWCSNSSVNLYLYCLTGSRFRTEFKNIVCCCQWNREAQKNAGLSSTQMPSTSSSSVRQNNVDPDET